jgi:hypothetical protein
MTRGALFATILMVALGCDKTKGLPGFGGRSQPAEPPVADRLDLSTKPNILFQVYGERDDPRMIPVAVIDNGALKPIVLASTGWRQFDAIYARSGAEYLLYQDGRHVGSVRIKQGMWEKDEPIYTLPSCKVLTPISAVTLGKEFRAGYTVELLASNAVLGSPPKGTAMAPSAASRLGKQVGYLAGDDVNLAPATLDSLDFRVVAINTGATPEPTLIASFIDPNAEEAAASGGRTAHVFVIADKGDNGYQPTFKMSLNGSAATAEYRRYVDHLDFNGDGIDEIVLEGWQYGGDTYLLVLSYLNGAWKESFRGRTNWCLDPKSQSGN